MTNLPKAGEPQALDATALRTNANEIEEWLHNDEGAAIIEILHGDKCGDGPNAPPTPALLHAGALALEQVETLKDECEVGRMQLAACSSAALGNTRHTAAERIAQGHPYWSAAYSDICRTVDREMAYREQVETLKGEIDALRNWRADVTVSLRRDGGAFYADVPAHVRDLVTTVEALRAELKAAIAERDTAEIEATLLREDDLFHAHRKVAELTAENARLTGELAAEHRAHDSEIIELVREKSAETKKLAAAEGRIARALAYCREGILPADFATARAYVGGQQNACAEVIRRLTAPLAPPAAEAPKG